MQAPEPQPEHRWLQKLVGEWTYEGGTTDGDSTHDSTGTETVRPLGDLWILAEGSGEMPDGSPATTLMTLGFDSERQRFVGTWAGSMMPYLWIYDGGLDTAGKVLTLESDGPSMRGDGSMDRYRDVIEIVDDDRRLLRSQVHRDDGEWHEFMVMTYRRRR
ncbi:MAG TPA: DUF1579 domain-containing protein [Thermoanaerobaculia bacterium]|nr:DUF1579 domain-containing protein [Thermoanaerobaculia bacterium]